MIKPSLSFFIIWREIIEVYFYKKVLNKIYKFDINLDKRFRYLLYSIYIG